MIYSACGTIVLAKGDKPAWLIIKVPDDLGRYYGRFHKLQQPLNGTHITIVAGEKEGFADASRLKPYVGRQVNFAYDGIVYTDRRSYWINCDCAEAQSIRAELGLQPKANMHITIGNTKNV